MERNSDLNLNFMHLKKKLIPKLAWNAKSVYQHKAWRTNFSRRLRSLLGDQPQKVPMKVDWAEKVEAKDYTRHKIYICSEKHYWIPAFFFVPKELKGPVPAIVCLHGHSGIYPYIREGNQVQLENCIEHNLDFAPFLAEHGYVTIAPIQRGWDETAASLTDGEKGCSRMVMDSLLAGMTPIGLRCWDVSRIIDFLETQKIVDKWKIGVAGLSGGGTVALFSAALERRIKVAMVAGYFSSFKASIYSIHHCLCNCIPGILEWCEMSDVAALISPRPLLIINGTQDPIFPIKAARKAYSELKKVYDLLNAGEKLDKDFFDGGHAWSNHKTLSFLEKHFG